MARLSLAEIRALAARVLEASKTSPANAAAVADALAAADADGIGSHGIARLPSYADQALSGKVDGFAVPEVREAGSAALVVDAKDGFAYPAIDVGFARVLEFVPHTGVVAVAVRHSHHFGVAGHHVERLAEKGLAALLFGNSPAGIGPWGGTRALYGTNPIAFACPRAKDPPLVIDLSLSKVARGKIKLAADKGEPIPEGWATDAEGKPTTDAKAAMKGMMLPMGDAKGAQLVLMVEILAAALTGSHYGFEASSFFDAKGPPPRVGQFFVAFDPVRFAGPSFAERLEVLLSAILAQPGTRLPGQRRLKNRAKALAEGVDIPDDLYAELRKRAGG
jgi:(2R)-3-sulfolactate dehydrogenase (NADP+)